MKKKYNLALIPVSKSHEIAAIAKKFSGMADGYLLGEKSLPHVTLYQFQAEEYEIDQIWEQVCNVWEGKTIDLAFNKFSCITFDNHIFWASLLPGNSDTDTIHAMHRAIANTLRFPIKKTFDPHMTLISTKNKEYEKKVALISASFIPITDAFILSLGKSDDIGQLIEVIHRCEIKRNMTCKL